MTYNKFNNTTLVGRLATDPDERTNTDGSTKVYLKIYVKTAFQGNNGQTVEECIDVEAYVPTNTKSPYTIFHAGDLVYITTTVRNVSYIKNGETKSRQFLQVTSIDHLEPKTVTEERLIKRGKNNE